MRISTLRLRDVKRHRDLQVELAPGLTIVRGPNESGKTTIVRALELALTGTPQTNPTFADGLRSWAAAPSARPSVRLDFSAEPADLDGTERHGSVEKSFGAGATVSLTVDGVTTTDPGQVDALLAELSGLPTAAFFRSSALIGRGELDDLDRADATLRERLAASISAADRGTALAVRELERVLADLHVRGDRDPGRLRIAEEAVTRSQTIVEAGEAALVRLAASRAALGAAEVSREAAEATLARYRDLLEQARRAEILVKEEAAATERLTRFTEAVALGDELTALHYSHPSDKPLAVVRQAVERLRGLDAKITELRAMLSGEIQVNYELATPGPTWRPVAILAFIAIAAGVALALAGQLSLGPAVLGPIGLGVVGLGAVLAVVGIRQRRAALDMRTQQQLADVEIDRRLRGRSQMEAELRAAEAESANQLGGLGLPDLAAAEDLLAREEAHVAAIDVLNAKLEGLVGKEPLEALPTLRDAAAREAADKAHALAGLADEARAEGATARFSAEVQTAEVELEAARATEADARAQVAANPVDASQVAGEAERLALWREQLSALQHRARVHEAALGGLERATAVTVASATRYLEKRMVEDVERISGGRYRQVRIDDRTLDIQLVAPETGDWVDVRALSDGTLAQVYLVARLGLIRHATGDRRPPLVMDDPFVSFDDTRAARAFSILRDLTRHYQVIYLTCSDRYDAAADAVVELPGPVAMDAGTGSVSAATTA